jgi:hypothetical protein
MLPIFFSVTIITVTIKSTYVMGTCFIKLRLFFHKVSSIDTLFPPLLETLYAGRLQLFAGVSHLFTYAVVLRPS